MGTKVRADLTLTRDSYEQFKKLVPSVSAEVDSFVKRRVAELQGGQPEEDRETRLKELKAKYNDLATKTVRLERQLKTSVYFEEATALVLELGLKRDLSNTDSVTPRFLAAWKGDESFMHQYVNLMEFAADKKRALQALTVMRSEPIPCEPEAKANEVAETVEQASDPEPESTEDETEEESSEEDEEETEQEGFEFSPIVPEEPTVETQVRDIVPVSSEGDDSSDD